MSSVGRAVTGKVGSDHLSTVGNVPVVKSAVEEGERSLGLVVRNFMTSVVDAEETEVAVLANFTVLGSVHSEGFVTGCGELLAVGVVHGERDGFSTEPIADVVGVTVNHVSKSREMTLEGLLTRRTS